MQTAVVILNFNGLSFLEKYLPNVANFSREAEIIVADNASTDNSVFWLEKTYPNIRLVKLKENLGFAGGYNAALKQIEADVYVLLNSDVEVTENWLEPCLSFLHLNVHVAAVQPKIRSVAYPEFFEYAGAAGGHIDWLGYPFARGRIFETLEKDQGQYNTQSQCFWATGACMFIRSEDFHAQNGFDEFFFAHMEEIDLCWRLQLAGKQIYAIPDSTVFHVGGGTLSKTNTKKTYLNFRNSILMLYKNLPNNTKWFVIFYRLILDGLAGIQFILKGQWKHCLAIIQAHFAAYGAIWAKKVSPSKNAKKIDIIYKHSLVFQYFLKGKKTFKDL